MQKLTQRLMEENTARPRFKEFQEQQYRDVARIFVNAGYATLTSVKEMQEKARDFLMQDIRKGNKTGRTPKELRLIIEIFDTYPAPTLLKGTAEHPRFDEIEIPLKMAKWKWSMNNLTGMLAPDQEMTNFFSSEFAKAKLKRPPYIPFVIPDLKEQPWRPFYPAHTRAFENWQKLNSSHKKPTPMDTSFQAWTLYNMRFIISGELTGAWRTFGGISAQWSHFGLILNMAVVENATIAMAYEKNFRLEAAHLARMRADEIDWVKYLSTEDEIIKKNVLRDLGHTTSTFLPKKGPFGKRTQKGQNPEIQVYQVPIQRFEKGFDRGYDKGGFKNKGGKKGGKQDNYGRGKNGWLQNQWQNQWQTSNGWQDNRQDNRYGGGNPKQVQNQPTNEDKTTDTEGPAKVSKKKKVT